MALALTTSRPHTPLLLPLFLKMDVVLMCCQSRFEALFPINLNFPFSILLLTFFFVFDLGGFHCCSARNHGGSRLLHNLLFLPDLVLGGCSLQTNGSKDIKGQTDLLLVICLF